MSFLVVFAFGLASGLHCLQMCGPIVLVIGPSRRSQLAYHGGRILTYMFLGALAGAAGSGLGMLGRLAGLASGARIFAGAAMICAGAVMLGVLRSNGLVAIDRGGALALPARLTRAIARRLTAPRGKFAAGLMLGFLPCGLIYAALLKAVDAASAPAGALTMLAFGLGTAAALLAIGFAAGFAGSWINRAAPISVMIAGAVLLWRALHGSPICHG